MARYKRIRLANRRINNRFIEALLSGRFVERVCVAVGRGDGGLSKPSS